MEINYLFKVIMFFCALGIIGCGWGVPFLISKQLLSKDDEVFIPTIKMIFISREKITKKGRRIQQWAKLLLFLFLFLFLFLYVLKVNLL
ncbi:hypothetical protein BZG23_15655 [Salinivibrio sp. ML290]|nr:hypothetical protein BZG23_15655 [Salinivibrio sp. ML290]